MPKSRKRSRPRPTGPVPSTRRAGAAALPATPEPPPPTPQAENPEDALRRVARNLDRADRARARWLSERDVLVAAMRAQGVSWSDLARLAGTSRQALMKRDEQ